MKALGFTASSLLAIACVLGACGTKDDAPPPSKSGGATNGDTGGKQGEAGGSDSGAADTGGSSPSDGGTEGDGGANGDGGAADSGGGTADGGGPGPGGAPAAGGEPSADGGSGGGETQPLPSELAWTLNSQTDLFEDIWGADEENIYAVGRNGSIFYSTGDGVWTSQSSGTAANLTGVWGSGSDDIYISANSNAILHSEGDGTWTRVLHEQGYTFRGVWGSGPDDVYMIGPGAIHYDGASGWSSPQEVEEGAPLHAIWGSSANDVYIVSSSSDTDHNIFHSSGDGNWKPQEAPQVATMNDIWGVSSSQVYAAGSTFIFSTVGNGSWSEEFESADDHLVNALWAAHSGAIFACTEGGDFYRSNGQGEWSAPQVVDPSLSENALSCFAMWGTSEESIYMATNRGIYHGTR